MNFILAAIVISLATLGFRAITAKGKILYFLRKPFDKYASKKEALEERLIAINNIIADKRKLRHNNSDDWNEITKEIYDLRVAAKRINPNKYNWIIYIGKPLLTCSTCMASVHTLIWIALLYDVHLSIIILLALMNAFLNTILWATYEMIERIGK